uniref:Uncharacterized protein n=1 Tax=Rhizophora mucronata TaxID=61149 RepID=A0A2P2NZF8_RHIMU
MLINSCNVKVFIESTNYIVQRENRPNYMLIRFIRINCTD